MGHRAREEEETMSLLDILLGVLFIVLVFAVMASVVLVTGSIFYRFHRGDAGEPREETIFKKTRNRKKKR